MPEDMISLRCKYCGAPLEADDVKGDSAYVTCGSCGTTQQRIDARAYLDQLTGQVLSWLNKAIPGGAVMAQSSSVDAVARHNIYVTNIQPKIDAEFGNYKFGLISMISKVLMVMPFTTSKSVTPSHTAAKTFEFGAKLKGVAPLAVSDDTAASLSEASGVTDAYAVLINNCALLSEDKPGRYILMGNNFTTAYDDLKNIKGYEPAALRFKGLALLCNGCEALCNGNAAEAYGHFESGVSQLKEAAQKLAGNMKVPVIGPALGVETKMGETLVDLAGYVNSMGGSKEVFEAVQKLSTYTYPTVGEWGCMFQSATRMEEILGEMGRAANAKSGNATITVAPGDGDILVPFWHIMLNYSFETGSLWKKKSVKVTEQLLVAADFPIDDQCLRNPRKAITDVFANAGSAKFFDKISGNQDSISNSAGIAALVSGASQTGASGRSVVVPLSTKKEGEKLAEAYVRTVAGSLKQLRLSNPDVAGLVYVPFSKSGDSVVGGPSLIPDRTKRMNLSNMVIL